MTATNWNQARLKKGGFICFDAPDNVSLSVEHVDRTIDPYFAMVIRHGVIIYTGLHATLADARNKCKEYL